MHTFSYSYIGTLGTQALTYSLDQGLIVLFANRYFSRLLKAKKLEQFCELKRSLAVFHLPQSLFFSMQQ